MSTKAKPADFLFFPPDTPVAGGERFLRVDVLKARPESQNMRTGIQFNVNFARPFTSDDVIDTK